VFACKEQVAAAERHLQELLPQLASAAKVARLSYVTVQNQGDYLVELPAARTDVPHGWAKVHACVLLAVLPLLALHVGVPMGPAAASSCVLPSAALAPCAAGRSAAAHTQVCATKKVCRYHPNEVKEGMAALARAQEQLQAACGAAWAALLRDFTSAHHAAFREAAAAVAQLDALHSLALVAASPGYCRPKVWAWAWACVWVWLWVWVWVCGGVGVWVWVWVWVRVFVCVPLDCLRHVRVGGGCDPHHCPRAHTPARPRAVCGRRAAAAADHSGRQAPHAGRRPGRRRGAQQPGAVS
jgi:hypothetical protein